jgi:putative Holliday junction resolvase
MSNLFPILALDVGDVRVGVALADAPRQSATPVDTYERAQGRAELQILKLIADRAIAQVVVGLPLGGRGERTEQCQSVEKFVRRLAKRTPVPFVMHDEHLTTEAAKEWLSARGKRATPKGPYSIDAVSAAVILDEYLALS